MTKTELIQLDETDRWQSFLKEAGLNDIYYTPEYLKSWNGVEEGVASLFIYRDSDGMMLYPFRIRNISGANDWCDIRSPYGYGGPYLSIRGDGDVLRRSSKAAFDEFCCSEKIVSEFCRFHPILDNATKVQREWKPELCNQTVWVELKGTGEDMLASFRSNHRRDVKKAIANGIEVMEVKGCEGVDIFHDLYIQSMNNAGAAKFYFFDKEFFRRSIEEMKGKLLLLTAVKNNKEIAAAIYLYSEDTLHYHFGGMSRGDSHFRANKLIHYTAMKWGLEHGMKKMHLGGGNAGSDADSLMHFKAGFSTKRADFYISKLVHNEAVYTRLCEEAGVDRKISYFPAYRAVGSRLSTTEKENPHGSANSQTDSR